MALTEALAAELAPALAELMKPMIRQAAMEALKASQKPQDELWTSEEAGKYLKVAPRYVMEKLACQDGFPAAIRLPATNGRGHPKWKASEVKAWADKHKGK